MLLRKVIVISLIPLFLIACLVTYILNAPLPPINDDPLTTIYSGDRRFIGTISDGLTQKLPVRLDQIPVTLQKATIAVEDTDFYHHHGLTIKGIARAMLADALALHIVQGGSTITQQLAKNRFLTGERSLWRKIKEAIYALQMERHMTKKQILTAYLNSIYYGQGALGIGAAARRYFDKPVQTLNLAECAFLAGLPKAPSLYNPYTNQKKAKMRQAEVLHAMVRAGFLDQAAMRLALATPLTFSPKVHTDSLSATYFTDRASVTAAKVLHLPKPQLARSGFLVHTTQNDSLNQAAAQAITRYVTPYPDLQVAVIAIDVHSGAILTDIGGRDYKTSPYDRVLAMRQPGSTFKPIVYATALDNGWSVATRVKSEPTSFIYGQHLVYQVHNFADHYTYLPISMKQALARSDNVFAVTTNLAVGPERVRDTALRYGFAPMQPYPSLALGVFPVSPYQIVRAYAAMANGGYLPDLHLITSITDRAMHVQYALPPTTKPSFRIEIPSTTYQLTDMLQSVMQPGGTGYRVAGMIDGDVAAKTGTTDTDAWMVGFTPSIACAVWIGYDHPRPLTVLESRLAAPIFASVMHEAVAMHPHEHFTVPSSVEKVWIDPETGARATPNCPTKEYDAFVKGTEPTLSCPLHLDTATSFGDVIEHTWQNIWDWLSTH